MAALALDRFQVFGPQHLVILGIFALGCAAAVLLGRRLQPRAATRFRQVTGAVILVACGPFEVADWVHAAGSPRTSLPVQVCDFAWLIACVALLTGSAAWSALLYYWGLTLSLQGVLTPDLDHVFPQLQFFGYWVRHLAPVWAAAYLVGARAGPTWRSYRFVLALTALWAGVMMVLNATLGSNYGYLNGKPVSHSLLDVLGPWPWYVVVEAALVVVGWALITWPWNRHPGSGGAGVFAADVQGHGGTRCKSEQRGDPVSQIEQSVDVNVPVSVAYNQWTQFESFPNFMSGVESITQVDDTHNHWVTNIAGVTREFDTEITEQHPDERVAWTSVDGDSKHAGVVTFHRLDDDTTRVMMQIEWEPSDVVEKVGSAVNIDEHQVKKDAERFKEFIESRGTETGAWRGDVEPG